MNELCDKAKFLQWLFNLKSSHVNDARSAIYVERFSLFGKKKLGLRAWICRRDGKIDAMSITTEIGYSSASTWIYTRYSDINRFGFTEDDLKKIDEFAFNRASADLATKFFGV